MPGSGILVQEGTHHLPYVQQFYSDGTAFLGPLLMDPKELRIGNRIRANGRIVEVMAIDSPEEDDIEVRSLEGLIVKAKLSHLDIQPILLTEEIAQTCCGFMDGYMQFMTRQEQLYFKLQDAHVVLLNSKREPMIHFWEIKTLHGLQNLYFAITRQEMKISFIASD
ncbi:MAG: hypothetical protein JSS82_03700 [Bacteroidetes bacterium]|nr:hypothetical protein [Bacteroidota bacterium]